MWPSPIARPLRTKRRSPGPSPRWSGAGTIDGFVTGFPFGARGWGSLAEKAHVQDARVAVALLGLYLRAHGDFTVEQNSST